MMPRSVVYRAVMHQTLGKTLATHRLRKDMSQEDVARAIGVPQIAYGRWERDAAVPRDADRIHQLIEVLGLPSDLFDQPDRSKVPSPPPPWAAAQHAAVMARLERIEALLLNTDLASTRKSRR